MATVEYKGKTFEVDEDGFLQKFEDWTLEWVDYVKDSEGIKELTPEHNKVIEFLDKPGSTIINTKDRDTGETALHIVAKRGA